MAEFVYDADGHSLDRAETYLVPEVREHRLEPVLVLNLSHCRKWSNFFHSNENSSDHEFMLKPSPDWSQFHSFQRGLVIQLRIYAEPVTQLVSMHEAQ